jgi:hypothetical protein
MRRALSSVAKHPCWWQIFTGPWLIGQAKKKLIRTPASPQIFLWAKERREKLAAYLAGN